SAAGARHVVDLPVAVVVQAVADLDRRIGCAVADQRAVRAALRMAAGADADAALAARATGRAHRATRKVVHDPVAVVVETVADVRGRCGAARAHRRGAAGLALERPERTGAHAAEVVPRGVLETAALIADARDVVFRAVAVVVDAVADL